MTSLTRYGSSFRVEGSVSVGRRPTGLSVAPDGETVVVSHFLPRGLIEANQGWVSVIDTHPLTLRKEIAIQDAFNLDSAHCFADTVPVSPRRVTSEAVSTQLAGFFMNPSGTEGWVPGARIAPTPITERGARADADLSSTFQPRPGEISAPFYFLFDTRTPSSTDRLISPGAIERPGIQNMCVAAAFSSKSRWTIARCSTPGLRSTASPLFQPM
ncbi:MAG: hypothetical protein NVSMB1_16360 [Polyangiales bacterium]